MKLIAIPVLIAALITVYLIWRKEYCRQSRELIVSDALLSFEELIRHGEELGRKHPRFKKKRGCPYLFSRLDENYRFISQVYKSLNEFSKSGLPLCPGCDWLLDNFFIIEEQYRELKHSSSPGLFRNLNIIKEGYLKNYPRVFVLALELISHTDGRLDKNQLIKFVEAYQSAAPLSMAELWALSMMLRIALLENIRHVCEKIISTQRQWNRAEELRGLSSDEVIERIKSATLDLSPAVFPYIEHALRVLKREDISLEPVIEYLSLRLVELETDLDTITEHEHKIQSTFQITMGNCISSLRLSIALDWSEIFESLSYVEGILRDDPSGIYPLQDFDTRNYYRHEIEKTAKKLNRSEASVAKAALELSRLPQSFPLNPRSSHIGYYIIGKGRKQLLEQFGVFRRSGVITSAHYTAPVVIITLLLSLFPSVFTYIKSSSIFLSILCFIVLIIPSSEIVLSIINYTFTHCLKPSFLPKLELGNGVLADRAAMVIVPTLLPDKKRALELLEKLEVTYIANGEENIYFGLVGDLKDSDSEVMDGDNEIIESCMEKVHELNSKYSKGGDVFYLFIRRRTFNPSQGKWMGWERKRGAIVEFNNLIKGGKDTTYSIVSGDISALEKVKYIITLDADTIMPIGTARRLIGTISHPLNRAVVDEKRGVVTEGYGLIQPRIGINIESVSKSRFTCIYGNSAGVDPYSGAISDIYQDMFGEGIFTGKGIYDVDVYRKTLNESIPDNTVLSHDLLEGSYLRCGLSTDIELIDGYPEKYSSYMMRLHRWTRGDWQIIKWLSHYVRNENGERINNPLSSLSRWKILDNMRRSLLPVFLMITIILGLTVLPGSGCLWAGIVLFVIMFPLATFIIDFIYLKHYKTSRQRLNGNIIYGLKSVLYQSLLSFILLPYTAFIMGDAILRTLYRVYVSKKNLLEWITAADAEKNSRNDLGGYIGRMSPVFIEGFALILLTFFIRPVNFIPSLILALIWFSSPFIAWYISQPVKERIYELSEEDRSTLLRIAKKTWDFYERFSGEEDNYLPPDNYQERPVERIAHRTSPTNIGFFLMSTLSAYDLGFISADEMVKRVDKTIGTVEKLAKWRGHLYNWYDTRSLEVLKPAYVSTVDSGNFIGYLIVLRQGLEAILESFNSDKNVIELKSSKDFTSLAMSLIERIDALIKNTGFADLYDAKRGLFSIGYNAEEDHLTNSYYDLLASEARLTSYIAVARREVPVSHWFKLGRAIVLIDKYESLVSWTGTMFEYLMPALVMKHFKNTLLFETYNTSISAQIKYGESRRVPWGTSESGYYTFDLDLNYQYRAFGVPDLGLKRGLIRDMVVSPYSTILALSFSPEKALENLKKILSHELEGRYGLYEAVDYTPERLPSNSDYAVVESFMAHHQGMILTALNNFLNKNIMVERFHSSPLVKAGEFLLQEKIPLRVIITKEHKETPGPFERIKNDGILSLRKVGYDTMIPVCHMLSNGKYSVMVNNSGSGFSRTPELQITRWREDTVSRGYGHFFFLRDTDSNRIWSGAYEPSCRTPDKYEARFSRDKAEFIRFDGDIETRTEICVSPEDNCEIRKITLRNNGAQAHTIECTSYFEVIISSHSADVAHPAFNNLFIRTQWIDDISTLIASRRQREETKSTVWAFHKLTLRGKASKNIEYETDRYKFIGRNRDISNPFAFSHPLTNTTGPVLDPVMSIRCRVEVAPGECAVLSYITGFSEQRTKVLEMADKYNEVSNIDRAFELAYIRSQMEFNFLNIRENDIEVFDDMMSHIIYLTPLRKKYSDIIKSSSKGQSGLWPYGISGDIPIVLVTIKASEDMETVKDMIKAHKYWRTRGLKADLVILNEDEGSYLQSLQNQLRDVVLSSSSRGILDSAGGIFIRNASNMPAGDIALLYAAARLIIKAELGNLKKQIDLSWLALPEIKCMLGAPSEIQCKAESEFKRLEFFNGYGGFDMEKREYVLKLKENITTPAPWTNVISNKDFGFIVTESGGGYTWGENSRENKITPWSNDPVSDTPGEIIYIRDDESGEFWSLTPSPIRSRDTYTVSHGFGYTRFSHCSHGIEQDAVMFVPVSDSVKICALRLNNPAIYKRRLSVFHYIRPVMGVSNQITEQFISTEYSNEHGTMLFRNSYNSDHPGRVSFISSSLKPQSYTGDRLEFLGPYGNISSPLGLKKEHLSNTVGTALNPCCALQYTIELDARQEQQLVILLGQGKNVDEAIGLASKYKSLSTCRAAFQEIKSYWRDILETVQVNTPDTAMNLMLNSYLLYQTTACRLFARSAFYQSGGAFGFRDQLQDVLSLFYSMPEAARSQILLHSSRQFREGDVLHWWHAGAFDRGIRTKFSDDLVWLPYVTAEYIEKTGDIGILDEVTGYVEDAPLKEDEDERYGIPSVSEEKSSLYEHCIRALDRALKFGPHGIPLMGSGDWNDGMNAVGRKGKGESIWLGFFIYDTLKKFIPLCKSRGDLEKAEFYEKMSRNIAEAIENEAWDGEWYRRSYFDDGTPLGSSINTECRIDSIAQSWAVISGAGNPDRVKRAMASVDDYLIKDDEGLILLFTPPFDRGDLRPGYIRGYVPGVRENGGQYTHASIWVIYAYAKMGNGDMAHYLFNLINPINHTLTQMECAKYKVEPYVMAADVYAAEPHKGRGGWTWYTGSSSWMYKVGLEQILGFTKKGNTLSINPCIPSEWKRYSIKYRYKSTTYNISVENPDGANTGVKTANMDGKPVKDNILKLLDDGKEHNIIIVMK